MSPVGPVTPASAAAGFARAATEGLGLRVTVDVVDRAWEVPDAVVAAMTGAVREALRNVGRHAGTDEATVTVVATARGLEVEVVDRGRGLGPDAAEGFGLRRSVREPLEAVGGGAEVAPRSPGPGTTVRLWWHAPPRDGDARLAQAYATTMRSSGGSGIARTVAIPLLLANAAVGLHAAGQARFPVATVLVVVALALATLVALRDVERGAPTARRLWAWGTWVAAAGGAGLLLAGPGALAGFDSFSVGFAALPLVLLAYVVPARDLPVLVVPPLATVVVALALDPGVDLVGGFGALNATVTPTAVACAIGTALRRSVADLDQQRHRVVRARADASRADFLARAGQRHLDHTRRRILPWLHRVASGELDLDDPAVRTRAALLAAEARDDLYVPEFFDDDLRELVTDFRRGGGTVVVRPGADPGVGERDAGRVLRSLLTGLPPGSRVTFHQQPDGRRVRLAVVPPAAPDLLATLRVRHPGVTARSDAFATTLHLDDLP
ncbi:sensor histidine kinase [Marmoricola sp. Leaf446]|uniref:sensor histidine kinase n=1 Tax=Marmoricola sp. Leaf446 TaxID=1736379 RepID=UPI000AB3BAFE|nr:hypothetical protein [Marmoricola sp. Leaf446]